MQRSKFSNLSFAIDELEEHAANRVGDEPDHLGVIRAIETTLLDIEASGEGLPWKVRRLIRAIKNEWDDGEIGPLCASILAEVRLLAQEDQG
jgi:hypothetical protein